MAIYTRTSTYDTPLYNMDPYDTPLYQEYLSGVCLGGGTGGTPTPTLPQIAASGYSLWQDTTGLQTDQVLAITLETDQPQADGREIQPGRCYKFDGTDDSITVAHDTVFNIDTTPTQTWHFEYTDFTDIGFTERTLFSKATGHLGSTGYKIDMRGPEGHRFWFNGSTSGVNRFEVKPPTFNDGELHKVTWVLNKTAETLKFYFDGELLETFDTSGATAAGPSNVLLIGGASSVGGTTANTYFFNQKMTNIAIYSTDLTDEEVIDMHKGNFLNTNCELLLKCDEATGAIALDSSGNDRHGTINNATLSTFHTTDNGLCKSWQNDVGYANTHNLIGEFSSQSELIGANGNYTGTFPTYTLNVTSTGGYGIRVSFDNTPMLEGDVTIDFTVSSLTVSGGANVLVDYCDQVPETVSANGNYVYTASRTPGTTKDFIDIFFEAASQPGDTITITFNSITSENGALIPRDESNITQTVYGQSLDYTGEVTYNVDLVNSRCARFDGSDDHVVITDYDEFNANSGSAFSMAAKIKTSAGTSQAIMSRSDYGTNERSWHVLINNTGEFRVVLSSDGTYSASTVKDYATVATINDGAWHDVAFVWAYGELKLFIDGVEQAYTSIHDASFTYLNTTSTADLTIGALYNSGAVASPFNGDICGVACWNDTLSDNDIFNLTNSEYRLQGMTGYWPLAEGGGSKAYNVSTVGEDGTITNATLSTFWGFTQDTYHYNYTKGFELYTENAGTGEIRVPINTNGSLNTPAIAGYTKQTENTAGDWHNDAETDLNWPLAPKFQCPFKHHYGRGYSFNGTSNVITVTGPSEIQFERTDPFSIAFYFKTTASGHGGVISTLSNALENGYMIYFPGTSPRFFLAKTSGDRIMVTVDSALNDGEWHHCVMTYDGSSAANGVTIYVDGEVASVTIDQDNLITDFTNVSDTSIGKRGDSVWYNGSLSDIKVFNLELTSDQALELWQNRTKVIPSGVNETSLVGWWPLQEGITGGIALDGSGYNNHGNITGATAIKNLEYPTPAYTKLPNNTPMYFDGTDDYVTYTADSIGSQFSLYAKCIATSTASSGSFPMIMNVGLATPGNGGSILYNGPDQKLYYNDGGSGYATSYTITPGEVFEVLATVNGTALNVYVNGSNVLTTTITSTNVTNLASQVGIRITSLPWKGIIYEAALFSDTLTSVNASDLYNGNILPDDLLSLDTWFKNTGNTNADWLDLSGNGNNGTVNGSPLEMYIPQGKTANKDLLFNPTLNADGLDLVTAYPNAFAYNTDGTQKDVTYNDIVDNYWELNKVMADVSVANQKKNIMIFDEPLVEPDLSFIEQELNH